MKTIKNRIMHLALIIGLSALFCGCAEIEPIQDKISDKIRECKPGDTLYVRELGKIFRMRISMNDKKNEIIELYILDSPWLWDASHFILTYRELNTKLP